MSSPGPSRLGRSTAVASSTLSFVLTLCLPYTSASPLPAQTPADSPAQALDCLQSTLDTDGHWAVPRDAVSAAGRLAKRYLLSNPADQPSPPTILTSSISSVRPIFALARIDVQGLYRLPDDYVALVQEFNPGFIVLSYAIAFVGSLCTLELLIRRTTNAGWKNQVLLASAGFTFGAVSTFAMHFIFNNSLSLHHPRKDLHLYPSLRLAYDPGFTILSLIVSCLAMTMAFFIMGTTLQDWWCIPGVRRRRRRESSVSGMHKRGVTDEYGTWKIARTKVLRRGTLGVGALLHRVGAAAPWSLMDGLGEDEKAQANTRWNATMTGKGSKWDEAFDLTQTDEFIRKDKKLKELDFRLGRSAVEEELMKRQEAVSSTTSQSTQATEEQSPSARDSSPSMSSTTSEVKIPTEPARAFYPPNRRNSTPLLEGPKSDPLFAPDFNFPPKSDLNGVTPNVVLRPMPASASADDVTQPGWTDASTLPVLGVEQYKRRASLPLAALTVNRDAPVSRPTNTLSRIQSLPEVEPEFNPLSSSESYDQTPPEESVKPDPRADHAAGAATSRTAKHVDFKGRPVFTKIEKFLGFDVVTRGEIIKVLFTGAVAGCGVVGMHYIGQLSITGMPYIAYKPAYVVGSVLIACGAVIVALYIMFIMLRPKLKHTWTSKIVVALILAVAVCGMHFCGMRGTIYAWPTEAGIAPSDVLVGTNKVITGIVAALAFLACIACAVFFVLHSIKLRRERARRRRVVVAAVFMDPSDRILVSSIDGMLPMCDIASLSGAGHGRHGRSSGRSFKSHTFSFSSDSTVLGMDLTPGHEAFVSALKMSWGWKNPSLTTPLAHGVSTEAVSRASQSGDARRGSTATTDSAATSGKAMRLSVQKFLERFAASSGHLATQLLGAPDGISRIGVLYDQILTTGWVKLNNSNDTVSKGQLIFLVRRVTSPAERSDLVAKHFIFAEAHAVASALHKTLAVPYEHTVPLLDDIRVFCDSSLRPTLKQGVVYAGVAVVQATPFDGLRILLEQDNRAQLPMRELCSIGGVSAPGELSGSIEEIAEALSWLDGMSLLAIITRNMNGQSVPGGERVSQLLAGLERVLVPMLDEMLEDRDIGHLLPRLLVHPALVPLTPGSPSKSGRTGYTPPYLIVFYANYDAAVNTFTDKWLPFRLFRAQNACVMAPRITALQKAEQAYNPQTSTVGTTAGSILDGTLEDFEYSRRPSKVQFDFSDNGPTNSGSAALPPSSPAQPVAGGMFSGFAFPAKDDAGAPSSPRAGGAGNAPPTGSAYTSTGMYAKRQLPGGPRRSSLVQRSRFDSDADLLADREKSSIPGVDEWDPDWLAAILRTKLRAEA